MFLLPSPPLPLRLYDGVAAMEREGEGEREGRSEGVFLTAAPEQEFVLRRREGEGSSARGHVSESEVAVGFSFGVRHMWEAFTVSCATPCSALCKAWSVPRIGVPPQGRCAAQCSAAQRRAPLPRRPQCMTARLGDGMAGRRHGWETAWLGDSGARAALSGALTSKPVQLSGASKPVQRAVRSAHRLVALAAGAAAISGSTDGWMDSCGGVLICWTALPTPVDFGCLGVLFLIPLEREKFPQCLTRPWPSSPSLSFPPLHLPLSSPQVFFAFSDGAVFAVCPVVPANV